MSVSSTFPLDPVTVTVEVSLLNVYDHKNIFYYDRDTGGEVTMLRLPPCPPVAF